jgi:hypothetical protein
VSRFEAWVERHRWAYPFAFPVLLPYVLYKLLKALTEWRS